MKKILSYSVFLATLAASVSLGAEQCLMTFSACPKTFHNDTIEVPEKVAAIAPDVLACTDTLKEAPSFFFIIDNSGSMMGSSGNDPTAARFAVTRALLDTIYNKQQNAQVGVAVFQASLYFDPTTTATFPYSSYFRRMSRTYDSLPDQAYLQLMTLNQLYGGVQGIDIIDSVLSTTGTGSNINLRYRPNFTISSNTNINIAFLAAREAFVTAAAPAKNQYIIFLSDGEPNRGWNDPGVDSIWYFRDSTRNVPTTFTVYFNSSATIPQSIQTMTQNIAANGYSTSNPNSAYFTISASYSSLMNVLMSNVFIPINGTSGPVQMVPVKMELNSAISNTYSNGAFVFADSFAIGTAVSPFSMFVTFQYTDPATNAINFTKDSTVFYVRHSDTATPSAGIGFICAQNTIPFMDVPVYGTPHVSAFSLKGHKSTKIQYAVPPTCIGSNISIEIYTLQGSMVRRISDKATGAFSNYSWDERDASGRPVRPGSYIIRLNAGAQTIASRFAIMR